MGNCCLGREGDMRGVLLEPGCCWCILNRDLQGCLGRGWWGQRQQVLQRVGRVEERMMRWERRRCC